jgi:sorting nexin-4
VRDLAWDSDPSDVTSSTHGSPPSTPTTFELDFEDASNESDFDQISDREEKVADEACWRGDPIAVRRRAMAEDFSEGKLETLVDSPQKENAGTQTQYVSYQITTKVGTQCEAIYCL